MRLKFPLFMLSAAAFMFACTDSDMFKNIHVKPKTTLPIGNINANDSTLFDLAGIANSMHKGDDDVLTFTDSTALTLSAAGIGQALVAIPDQNFTISPIPTGITPAAEAVELPAPVPVGFNLTIPGGGQIDSMIFQYGTLSININGLDGVAGYDPSDLVISLANLKYDRQPVTIVPGRSLTLTPDYIFDLGPGHQFTLIFSGKVPGNLTALSGSVSIHFGDLEYVAGFFGRKVINSVTRTINANSLNDFTRNANYIRFENPQVAFEMDNAYNAPMLIQIDALTVDGIPVPLKTGLAGEMFYIVPQGHTRMVLSNDNTMSGVGLTNMLTKDFTQLGLTATTILNPTPADLQDAGYVAPDHNSLHAKDTLGGAFAIVIPLEVVMEDVAFDQEIEVDLKDLDKDEFTYEKMALTLSGINQLPLELEIMIYVTEPGSAVKTALFDNAVSFPSAQNNLKPEAAGFQPGTVDGSNLIVRTLNSTMIDKLLKSEKMYLQITASTLNASARESVKIYTPSELKLRIVTSAELDYVLNAN